MNPPTGTEHEKLTPNLRSLVQEIHEMKMDCSRKFETLETKISRIQNQESQIAQLKNDLELKDNALSKLQNLLDQKTLENSRNLEAHKTLTMKFEDTWEELEEVKKNMNLMSIQFRRTQNSMNSLKKENEDLRAQAEKDKKMIGDLETRYRNAYESYEKY